MGGTFEYSLSRIDGGYYLCFGLRGRKHQGCCYLPRHDLWDCSPGVE